MSMGSNMMGMQGPTHSSSCSSTHIPSMHSEAKLVSLQTHAFCSATYTFMRAPFAKKKKKKKSSTHTLQPKVLQPSLFHWTVPAKLCS